MISINKFLVLVILNFFGSCESLVQLPSVEENDIWKTEVAIRATVNNLFSLLQLKGSTGKSKIKQYTTVHNSFISQTLQDYDTLKEIAKLTRVDKRTLQNVTTDFIDTLNRVINDEKFSELTNTLTSLNNFEDEIHNLQYMKEFYASPKYYSGINIDLLKILESRVETIIITLPKEENATEAKNKEEKKHFDKLLEISDIWKPKKAENQTRRIYAGDYAQEKNFPFLASIEIFKKFHCGASVIKSDLLLTAASCLQLAWNNRYYRENPLFLRVRVGSQFFEIGGEVIEVLEIYFHPQYSPKTLENNIAIIRTVRHMNLHDRKITKVKRIELDTSEHNVPQNVEVLILGWGAYSGNNMGHIPIDGHLRKFFLPVYGLKDCQEIYSNQYVRKTNFCAGFASKGNGGACNRDAGGPGVLNGYLVGVVSFGSPVCGTPDTPTVFTKVGFYYDWIEYIMMQNVSHVSKMTTKKVEEDNFYIDLIHPTTKVEDNFNVDGTTIPPFSDAITTNTSITGIRTKPTTTKFCFTPITEAPEECAIRQGRQSKLLKSTTKKYHPKYIIHEGVKYKMIPDSIESSQDEVSYKETPKHTIYFAEDGVHSKQTQTTKDLSGYSPVYKTAKTTEEPYSGDFNIIDHFIEHKIPRSKINKKQIKLFKQFIRSIFNSKNDVEEFINILKVTKAYVTKAGPTYANRNEKIYSEERFEYNKEEPFGLDISSFEKYINTTPHEKSYKKDIQKSNIFNKPNNIEKSKTKSHIRMDIKDKSHTKRPDNIYKSEVISVEMLSKSLENVIHLSGKEKHELKSDSDYTHDIYKTPIKSYGKDVEKADTSHEFSKQVTQKSVVDAKTNEKKLRLNKLDKIYESQVQGSKMIVESDEEIIKYSNDPKIIYTNDKQRLETTSKFYKKDKTTSEKLLKLQEDDANVGKADQENTQISEELIKSNEVQIIVPKEDLESNKDKVSNLDKLNESYIKDLLKSATSSEYIEIEPKKQGNESLEKRDIVGEIYEEYVPKSKKLRKGNERDNLDSDEHDEDLNISNIITGYFEIEAQTPDTPINSFEKDISNLEISFKPDRKDFKKPKQYAKDPLKKSNPKSNEKKSFEFDLDFASFIQNYLTNAAYVVNKSSNNERKTTKTIQKYSRIRSNSNSKIKIKRHAKNEEKKTKKIIRLFELKSALPLTETNKNFIKSPRKMVTNFAAKNNTNIHLFKTVTEKYKEFSANNVSILSFQTQLNSKNKQNETKHKLQDAKIKTTTVTPSTKSSTNILIGTLFNISTNRNLVSKDIENSSIPFLQTRLPLVKTTKRNIQKSTIVQFNVQLGDKNKNKDSKKTLKGLDFDSKTALKKLSKTSMLTTFIKKSEKTNTPTKKTIPKKTTKPKQKITKSKSAKNIQSTVIQFRIQLKELNKIQKNQTNNE